MAPNQEQQCPHCGNAARTAECAAACFDRTWGSVPAMGGPDTAAPFKRCSCGQPYTAEQWSRLPHIGEQHVPEDDEGPAETLELRLCVMCGSTMAAEVTR